MYLYPLAGGEPQALPGLTIAHRPTRFAPDGRTLFVQEQGTVPSRFGSMTWRPGGSSSGRSSWLPTPRA
jgi:hypothetical protein